MANSIRPGDLLAGRYRLIDLLSESGGGRFWRAHDRVLERHVALHVIPADDERAPQLLEAARRSATVLDQRILRVLDAETVDDLCYVVNEWGSGVSLDILVAGNGPIGPRRSAWLVAEVADSIAAAHDAGIAHGRLNPENVLVDRLGEVRIIGLCVDAALHGLPTDQLDTDVADLAGLLYCALTATWAGPSSSAVPPAPLEHGVALRPRRVRAGIPRPLDQLCDEVITGRADAAPSLIGLNGRSRGLGEVTTARGIADYLAEFVGDPTGMAAALAALAPALRAQPPIVLPDIPDPAVRDTTEPAAASEALDEPDIGPNTEPDPEPDDDLDDPEDQEADQAPAAAGPLPDDLPTQAGLPIFGDEIDEVSWLAARSTTPPPPPPFEEPPARPLFAPTPEDGVPVRRARPGSGTTTTGTGADYWPWEAGTGTSGTGTGRSAGSAFFAVPGTSREARDGEVPGRSWLRLAAVLATGLLLLVAVVVAYNLGRGKTVLGQEPADESSAPRPSASSSAPPPEAAPLTGLVATDLDPQGDPPEESPDEAPLAVDGDPATAWSTETYFDQLGPPPGLKTGVGLSIDLGEVREVSSVELTLVGAPSTLELYLDDTDPTSVDDLTSVASETADGDTLTVALDTPTSGRYLVVWFTALPVVDDGFRGEIAEVAVSGR